MDKKKEILELIDRLNEAAKSYYQGTEEIMSNLEYDELYDRLSALEEETGIVLSSSPTQKVGYEVLSSLPKEAHAAPMLSLDKTKDREALASWLGAHEGLLSWKLDGLTVVLTYENGQLVKALTRGNGQIGEVITANARTFVNLPLKIPHKGRVVLRGEAIISYEDFQKINSNLPEGEEPYKNPRNLCSGSVRQLNSQITAQRKVNLVAFSLVEAEGLDTTKELQDKRGAQLDWLEQQGFQVVERVSVNSTDIVEKINEFEKKIQDNVFPSDGLVLIYDDIAYGQSLGKTAKFPRDAIAFKWEDRQEETFLREILWSPSRTGLINPIAIFDAVELEGTTVSRASVHNISIMRELGLGIGDRIMVYKANMIIPQISRNLTKSNNIVLPEVCPVCGSKVKLNDENGVQTLICLNPVCPAKEIKSFTLLVSRDALNIDGISESTMERLIDEGIVKNFKDIFYIKDKEALVSRLPGFGKKSFDNMVAAIEKARSTKPERLLYGIGIPNIGVQTAKLIARAAGGKWENIIAMKAPDLMEIDGIGRVLAEGFENFFKNSAKREMVAELRNELVLDEEVQAVGNSLEGLTFVITGSLNSYDNRDRLKAEIEALGGKVSGSVSSKTSYLVNNDITSASGKNEKAKELGVEIINEEAVIKMIKG